MNWKEYFDQATGTGFLATTNSRGEVNIAVYSKPLVLRDGTFVFGMANRLTHTNLQENTRAVYAFQEAGYKGMRFYLHRAKEETSGELLDEIRKAAEACSSPGAGQAIKYAVHFRVDRHLPLVIENCSGDHAKHLCEIAGNEQWDLIKELAKMPQYMCRNCGRMSDGSNSLCDPMPIEDIPSSH